MCPACLTTIVLFAAGAISTSGIAAVAVKKLRTPAPAQGIQTSPPPGAEMEK